MEEEREYVAKNKIIAGWDGIEGKTFPSMQKSFLHRKGYGYHMFGGDQTQLDIIRHASR
jgi:hypothetical protein